MYCIHEKVPDDRRMPKFWPELLLTCASACGGQYISFDLGGACPHKCEINWGLAIDLPDYHLVLAATARGTAIIAAVASPAASHDPATA